MKLGRWIAVAFIAAALRLPKLDIRPMHGDEAVMAVKAGAMAWGGEGSAYDPTGYHGTLLGWMVQPVLFLTGAKSLADTDERHFRLVTAICGILLCLTPILLADGLGTNGAFIAGLLLAVSPAFVYWSRFYIQEVPLVLVTALALGCGWRFARSNRTGWLWGTATSIGLMLALKETAWLSIMAAAIALATVRSSRTWIFRNGRRLLYPAIASLLLPVLILGPSSFLAPLHYWKLGLSGGDHAHPWHWYFTAILNPGTCTTEWIPFVFALAVPILLFKPTWPLPMRRNLALFVLIWFALLAGAYALLPYKTPWCVLQFLFGGFLLAAAGIAGAPSRYLPCIRFGSKAARPGWLSVLLVLILAGGHSYQAWNRSVRQAADRRNPFVYAQPVEDARRLGRFVSRIAAVHPKGREMNIAVVEDDPWPLPWELRTFSKVGYWRPGDRDAKRALRATVIIGPATAGDPGVMFGLRPGKVMVVYAEAPLLDRALGRD